MIQSSKNYMYYQALLAAKVNASSDSTIRSRLTAQDFDTKSNSTDRQGQAMSSGKSTTATKKDSATGILNTVKFNSDSGQGSDAVNSDEMRTYLIRKIQGKNAVIWR